MKMRVEEAEERFGKKAITLLTLMNAEPTNRLISAAWEPEHVGMIEYVTGSISVKGGKLYAYYYQPADADDWEFGEMNGIKYGDIDNVEYIEDVE